MITQGWKRDCEGQDHAGIDTSSFQSRDDFSEFINTETFHLKLESIPRLRAIADYLHTHTHTHTHTFSYSIPHLYSTYYDKLISPLHGFSIFL